MILLWGAVHYSAHQRTIEREDSADSAWNLCGQRHGVITLWDGTATAKDSNPYKNTYSQFMTMKDGRIVKVAAIFDTIELTGPWERVPVKSKGNM